MLKLSMELSLPLDAVTQTFAILAKKRRGKTYTASVMAEEMHKAGLPFVVLDPTGAWWGLRASADGKRPGLPVTIIGGEHADIPLEASAGTVIAELVVSHPGHYIIDLSFLDEDALHSFAATFCDALYLGKARSRFPMFLFADEADAFLPQAPESRTHHRVLRSFDRLVRRGGLYGIGVGIISQRPALINKNSLTQVECLIALQIVGAADQEAVERWVRAHDSKGKRAEFMQSLASLGLGEAWVWSPAWLNKFVRVQIRQRDTFNSSKTPELGDQMVQPRVLAPVDLDAIRAKIAGTIERVKANDPAELKRQIAMLKREMAEKDANPAMKVTEIVKEVPVEVPTIPGNFIAELNGVYLDVGTLSDRLSKFLTDAEKLRRGPIVLSTCNAKPTPSVREMAKAAASQVRGEAGSGAATGLKSGALKMLRTLCLKGALSQSQLATLCGMTASGGTFRTYLGVLKRRGLVDEVFDNLQATGTGKSVGGSFEAETADQVIESWRKNLKSGCREMLDVLVKHHRTGVESMAVGELAAMVGMTREGGTFRTYLGILRRNGLAEVTGGTVRAGQALFI